VTTFIKGCSHFDPGRPNFLRRLSASDEVIRTNGSVLFLLGAEDAGVQAACRRCSSSFSPSYSAGPISSWSSLKSLALVHGQEWCHSHLQTCHFQSALALLSTTLAFLQPKYFWDIWDLSDSLSSHVALSFQWVPSHTGLPGNELADRLTKTGTILFCPCSQPTAPSSLQRIGTPTILLGDKISLLPNSISFLGETGPSMSRPL